ncbi:MAG: hypothetical protein WCS72_13190 [Deltaproteobacteria bacterium]
MGFSRAVAPVGPPEADTLTEDMAGIGMNLGGRGNHRANIENTLFFASEEGMDRADLRVLSVLVTWLAIHGARVNVDRLAKLIEAGGSKRVRAFWAAVGRWLAKDRRYSRLIRLHTAKPLDLLDVGTEFQIRRHGEDRRFEGTALRVPGNVLRDRPADVMTPELLARQHRVYSWRIVIGPTFRADMWAEMEGTPGLKAAEIARRTYGSFATAWQVKRDWSTWAGRTGR